MDKLCIVIPAYNEEKRIGRTLEVYSTFFDKLKNKDFNYNLLIVINNTKDRTEEIVRSFSKKNKHIKFVNLIKGGKGYAITEGFKLALKEDYSLIGFVDADIATSPEQFYRLVKGISRYDVSIANRYDKNSKIVPAYSFRRLIVSRIFNFIVRVLFSLPYHDTQCGAKLLRKEALEKVIPDLTLMGWAYDVNLLYACHLKGLKVVEVPTVWAEKEYSKLRVGKVSIQMFLAVLQLWVDKSIFRRLVIPLKPLIRNLWGKVK